VPLHGPGRRALGRLGRAEQVYRGAEPDRNRAKDYRLHEQGQDPAAETLYRDWDDFVAFYGFPAEHWLHLRTSNPIESVFAGVRLRTNVAKRARVRENALYRDT